LSPVPILTGLLAFSLYVMLQRRREVLPFILSIGLFTLSYIGLAISLWPNVVPPDITIWDAAADPKTQVFLLVGVAIVVPIILVYTAYSYYVFRGKVRPGEGYH
jgi:cytochrome d ubiquinol oxidase subunit II